MKYWWVNQNKTYKHEVRNNYMWSPKTKANGHGNRFYDYMTEVRAGDIVLSFADTKIKAVGVATGTANSTPIPEEFKSTATSRFWPNHGCRSSTK